MSLWRGLAQGPAYLRARGLSVERVVREALQEVDEVYPFHIVLFLLLRYTGMRR